MFLPSIMNVFQYVLARFEEAQIPYMFYCPPTEILKNELGLIDFWLKVNK